MEFKSQICTTVEQSKRLLELGLKKETADCMYSVMIKEYNGRYILEEDRQYNLCLFRQDEAQSVGFSIYEHIPAWSLHRLMEIMYEGDLYGFVSLAVHDRNIDTIYELVIANIAGLIDINRFNTGYLEEKK